MNKPAEVLPAESRVAKINNPYSDDQRSMVVGGGASASAEVSRAVAEVKASIMLAKEFPRSRQDAVERILAECCRETLAEAATYSYTKGGQEISGPSIRLAEVIAQNWGNFHFGWDELSRNNSQSEILAWAWDYETNVKRTTTFFVKHWRDTKKGGYLIKDEREIYELCANQAARRMRACILNIIPGDVTEAAVAQCDLTLQQKEKVTPETIKKLLAAYEALGVSKAQIEKKMLRKAEGFNGANMMQLRKIYNGLKEGMSRVEEIFDPELSEVDQKPAASDAPAAEPSDWDAIVDDLALGLNGAADEKTLDAYMQECEEQLKKLSASRDEKAISKWSKAVAKRRSEIKAKLI